MTKQLSRRQALRGIAIGTAGAAAAPVAHAQGVPAAEPPGTCTLFPQAVEGPYYFDPKLVRSDISEGRPGLPMRLALRVIEAGPCTPLANARVDVWHADAEGVYSGYARQGDDGKVSTRKATFLRGSQMTSTDGDATFTTIFPGWYPGRTPHIHVKVFLDKRTLVTGQIYFPDELSAKIYSAAQPYAKRPIADTTNATDFIYRSGERDGGGIVFMVDKNPLLLTASLVIAVDRSGATARHASGWFPFLRRLVGL